MGAGRGRGGGRSYVPRPPDLPSPDDWALAAQESSGYTPEEISAARAIIDAVNKGDVSTFLVDSGASKYMCKDASLFTNFRHFVSVIVLGDGTKIHEDRIGDVNLPTACGILYLTDVLFVPALAVSLFSIARASFHGATCTFLPHKDGVYIEKSGSLLCTASYIK